MLTVQQYATNNKLTTRQVYRMIERGELDTEQGVQEEVKRKTVTLIKVNS